MGGAGSGLVFKALRPVYHSTLGSRVIQKDLRLVYHSTLGSREIKMKKKFRVLGGGVLGGGFCVVGSGFEVEGVHALIFENRPLMV